MNTLRYAWLHLRRSPKNTAVTLLSCAAVLMLLMAVQQAMVSRRRTLEDMAAAISIHCTVTDLHGENADKLVIAEKHYRPFIEESAYTPYLGEVYLKAVLQCEVVGQTADLVALTDPAADFNLKYNGVHYEEGCDASVWTDMEPVCILSADLLEKTDVGTDGRRYIDLTGFFEADINARNRADAVVINSRIYLEVPLTFRVAGVAAGEKTVYCPFGMLRQNCADYSEYISMSAQSLSFTVRDNSRLEEFRTLLTAGFREADPYAPTQTGGFALVVQDSRYLQVTQEASRSIGLMELLQPVLYLCALCAGVMLVVMQMRTRKRELAILRSLGTETIAVTARCLLEYILLCLPVTVLGFMLRQGLSAMAVLSVTLSFLLGAAGAILRFARIPLAQQIRELEE